MRLSLDRNEYLRFLCLWFCFSLVRFCPSYFLHNLLDLVSHLAILAWICACFWYILVCGLPTNPVYHCKRIPFYHLLYPFSRHCWSNIHFILSNYWFNHCAYTNIHLFSAKGDVFAEHQTHIVFVGVQHKNSKWLFNWVSIWFYAKRLCMLRNLRFILIHRTYW